MKCSLLFIVALIGAAKCSKILTVFPFGGRSHYIMGNTLARILVEAGHDVTMISAFGDKNPPKNGTYTDVLLTGFKEKQEEANKAINMFGRENMNPFIGPFFVFRMGNQITEAVFQHPNFQKLLNSNQEFDVVIAELFIHDALNGLAARFKAPLILFSATGPNLFTNSLVGNPSPPSYIPELLTKFSSNMTFFQRVYNWNLRLISQILQHLFYYKQQNKLVNKYLPDVGELEEFNYNASLVLLNFHESIGQPVPHVPAMIDVGGMHVYPPKPLPKDLKDFMDSATEGVIYFSMGSNIRPSEMPNEKRQAILKALGKVKQKVLWKWDEGKLPGQPLNVKISKWFPQQDILAHPNTKLFITHGGLLSTTETVYHGVPILAFPIFGDQKINAAQAEINGIGITLPFSEITEEKLTASLHKLLSDPKYKINAKKRSRLMHDRPVKPRDLVRYWVEYVIRHKGAPHLRVAGVDLPWYKYLLLDVIAFVILVNLCTIIGLYVLVKRLCCRRNKSKVKTN